MTYKIGSFNMYKCNFKSDEEIRKEFYKIAKIVKEGSFDIIGLQEVLNKQSVEKIVNNLGKEQWDYSWDLPRTANPSAAEGYAFIWKKKRFKLAEKSHMGRYAKNPQIYEHYSKKDGFLVRDPYYARFIPINGGYFEVRLINTHITYQSSRDEVSSLSSLQKRKKEFEILKNIYWKISEYVYDGRKSYTLLLGDYNLNLRSVKLKESIDDESFTIDRNGKEKTLRTVQKSLTTLKKDTDIEEERTAESDDTYFSNNFDHFSYGVDSFDGVIIRSDRINTLKKYYDNDIGRHRQEISDHVPVFIRMSLNNQQSIIEEKNNEFI